MPSCFMFFYLRLHCFFWCQPASLKSLSGKWEERDCLQKQPNRIMSSKSALSVKTDSDCSIVPSLFSVVCMPIKCLLAETAAVVLQDFLSHQAWVSTPLLNPVPSVR